MGFLASNFLTSTSWLVIVMIDLQSDRNLEGSILGRVVGHRIARANQKSIVFVPRDPTNPKKLVLEVGNHCQFGLLALLL